MGDRRFGDMVALLVQLMTLRRAQPMRHRLDRGASGGGGILAGSHRQVMALGDRDQPVGCGHREIVGAQIAGIGQQHPDPGRCPAVGRWVPMSAAAVNGLV